MHTLGHLLNAIKRTESHFPFQLNFARLYDMFFSFVFGCICSNEIHG